MYSGGAELNRLVILVSILALLLATVPGARAQVSSPCLDISDEVNAPTASEQGGTVTLTATIRSAETSCSEGETVFADTAIGIDFEFVGTNDPDQTDSPETPDATCTVEAGASECSISYGSTQSGSETIRGWIDADTSDDSVEADRSEGQVEGEIPGEAPEPDQTDTVSVRWSWTHGPDPCSAFASCVATVLTIRHEDGEFKGAVGSPRRPCQRSRRLTLKKVRPGKDDRLGRDRSNHRGNWRIDGFPNPHGRYYAVVSAKTYAQPEGADVLCPRDRSVTIRL